MYENVLMYNLRYNQHAFVFDKIGATMPWIRVFTVEEATGFLKEQYDAAIKRAGRIWNIVAIMGQNPRAMKASMDMYGVLMHGPSPLSRSQREMLATVTSSVNHCLY
jgi:alkylhydroperoxidase family enzyme